MYKEEEEEGKLYEKQVVLGMISYTRRRKFMMSVGALRLLANELQRRCG